jgi:NADH-quinone oxidoreductase subunit F
MELVEAFRCQLDAKGLSDVDVRATGCHGFCEQGPLVVIFPQKIFYRGVQIKDVDSVIEKTILNDELVESLLFKDPVTKEKYRLEHDVPFYAKQQRIVFRNNGKIDPAEIDDYIAADGYAAMAKALTGLTPEEVIQQVQKKRPARTRRRWIPNGKEMGYLPAAGRQRKVYHL